MATIAFSKPVPQPSLQKPRGLTSPPGAAAFGFKAAGFDFFPLLIDCIGFGSILNDSVRFRTCQHANVGKHPSGIKRIAPRFFEDGCLIFSERSIDLHHLWDARLSAWAPEGVAQPAQHPANRRAVNLWVCTLQVA